MKTTSIFVSLITALVLLAGCSEHTPDRDHMPLLRARLFQLQQAVKGGDRAAIDSLMSIRIIDNRQGSDSLLNFIYGADRSLSFDRFDNYDIVYTHSKAQIGCEVVDSTGAERRPVKLNYIWEHDLWLLTSFVVGGSEEDSTLQ